MQDYWAKNPGYKVAYDQLLSGPTNPATAGSVIGNYVGVRDAVREGENSMFLKGTAPKTALKDAATKATAEIDRLQRAHRRQRNRPQPRSSIGTYGRFVGPT